MFTFLMQCECYCLLCYCYYSICVMIQMLSIYSSEYGWSCIHHALICTTCVCCLFAGYAEENSYVDCGTSSCYYNCTVDSSMAPQCHSYANISVTSYPSTTNQSMLTPNGLNYIISDLQRCQRYTVEVTAQVGAHKYTNQTQVTVTLGECFYWFINVVFNSDRTDADWPV